MTNGEFNLKDRTKAFALRIIKMFRGFAEIFGGWCVGQQVLRSGISVGANYREADSARSKAKPIAKMGDALKELAETAYWLELLVESKTCHHYENEALARRNVGIASHLRQHHPQIPPTH